MAATYHEILGLALKTDDAYMFDAYEDEGRWSENIRDLLDAGYSAEAVEWIVRSKIARWANDTGKSMLDYINQHVGDARLRDWMRQSA